MYRGRLAGALEVHAFNRDVDDTSQRVAEKAVAMNTDDVGRDLAAVEQLQRKQETLERDMTAVEGKLKVQFGHNILRVADIVWFIAWCSKSAIVSLQRSVSFYCLAARYECLTEFSKSDSCFCFERCATCPTGLSWCVVWYMCTDFNRNMMERRAACRRNIPTYQRQSAASCQNCRRIGVHCSSWLGGAVTLLLPRTLFTSFVLTCMSWSSGWQRPLNAWAHQNYLPLVWRQRPCWNCTKNARYR